MIHLQVISSVLLGETSEGIGESGQEKPVKEQGNQDRGWEEGRSQVPFQTKSQPQTGPAREVWTLNYLSEFVATRGRRAGLSYPTPVSPALQDALEDAVTSLPEAALVAPGQRQQVLAHPADRGGAQVTGILGDLGGTYTVSTPFHCL